MPDGKTLVMVALMLARFAAAQQLSCTFTTNPRNVRAEGLSELVGDIVLQCVQSRPGTSSSPYLTSQVMLYLNTNQTNRLHSSGGRNVTDAVLVINDNHADPSATSIVGGPARDTPVPQYAEVLDDPTGTLVNGLIWRGVQIPIPGALSPSGRRFPDPTVLRITNVRANANALGIGIRSACSPSSTRIVVYNFTVNDSRVLPGAVDQFDVGFLQPGVSVSVRPGPHGEIPSCRTHNISAGSVSGAPSFFVRFREGFPDALRPVGTPASEQGLTSEAGYPTPGLGASGGSASQGSRLLVSVVNVPAGVRLSAPKEIVEGRLRLRMTVANSLGAGPFSPMSGDGTAEASVTNGTAAFAWEVVASDPAAVEQIDIPVITGFSLPAGQTGSLGQAIVYGMLGPVSTITSSGASVSAPVPRFAAASFARNAFSVVPCCSSCQDLSQVDPGKPLVARITPAQLTFRDTMPRLTISGSGFTTGSVVEWEDATLATTFVSATEISAAVDVSVLRNLGRESARIAVRNPNGIRSNSGYVDIVHPFRIDALADAAGGTTDLAPGGLVSMYGDNLARGRESAGVVPLPRQLQGARVNVQWQQGAVDSPVVYASPAQVNFQLPYEVQGTATISIVNTDGWRRSVSARISEAAPEVFCSGQAPIITHADGTLVTLGRPARAGEVVVLYVTGLGRVENQPATGSPSPGSPLARTRIPVSAPMTGFVQDSARQWSLVTATGEVLFAGLVPGFIGLGQVNVRIPTLTPGSVAWELQLEMQDNASLGIPLAVQTATQ